MGTDAPDSTAYTTLSSAVAAHPRYDATANSGSSDASSQVFQITYKTNQYASLFTDSTDTSSNSVLSYSAINETTNGPASSAISFSTTDSQLARSGYSYVVQVLNSAGSVINSYTTLTSAVAAQKYDIPQMQRMQRPTLKCNVSRLFMHHKRLILRTTTMMKTVKRLRQR